MVEKQHIEMALMNGIKTPVTKVMCVYIVYIYIHCVYIYIYVPYVPRG